ncbi:hypothetical protein [Corynebacterium striatum]|uniref:hypothetical protein n=1 Tax=Corynebacterium striatum TaxID=43770 RepID=UPI001A192F20|nr:hypothetical protein [Corynebacterium striatum]HAT1339453.1 hypothetical protein [Corynebacterium striatum]
MFQIFPSTQTEQNLGQFKMTTKPSPSTSVSHKTKSTKEAAAKASKTPIFIFCTLSMSIAPLFKIKTNRVGSFPVFEEISSNPKSVLGELLFHFMSIVENARNPLAECSLFLERTV